MMTWTHFYHHNAVKMDDTSALNNLVYLMFKKKKDKRIIQIHFYKSIIVKDLRWVS